MLDSLVRELEREFSSNFKHFDDEDYNWRPNYNSQSDY